MEYLLYWVIVGVVAGYLARIVVPGESPGGIVGDLLIGILGSVAGGAMFNTLGRGYGYGGIVGSTGVAFVGAVALLLVMRFVRRSHV
jgi:uncharacterized membrane protein YeaQ/YmgE (transglycosylase-associated protein family)